MRALSWWSLGGVMTKTEFNLLVSDPLPFSEKE